MQLENVHLAYQGRTILRDITLSIQPGEFIFLIGTSGSGKTSFIRSLIGVLPPKTGTITNDDSIDIYSLNQKKLLQYRRDIGIIFQDFKLLPKKTVRENVAFAMEVCGYDSATIERRIPEVLSQVGLLSKKEKFIESLSGGELQRTAIARALIHNPKIIIGDEPTGNLDPQNAEEIIQILVALSEQGKTIVLATHDDRLVNRLQKRVLIFRDGIIHDDPSIRSYHL